MRPRYANSPPFPVAHPLSLEIRSIPLPLPTARLVGLIELLTAAAKDEAGEATLLGTLRILADKDGTDERLPAWNETFAGDAILCDCDRLASELEAEFWQLEPQNEVVVLS